MLHPPALSPKIVILFVSPPKAAMFLFTHFKLPSWSHKPERQIHICKKKCFNHLTWTKPCDHQVSNRFLGFLIHIYKAQERKSYLDCQEVIHHPKLRNQRLLIDNSLTQKSHPCPKGYQVHKPFHLNHLLINNIEIEKVIIYI